MGKTCLNLNSTVLDSPLQSLCLNLNSTVLDSPLQSLCFHYITNNEIMVKIELFDLLFCHYI